MACILQHSQRGSRKTRLIYKCNLAVSQFNVYADCLSDVGLLRKSSRENGVRIYETTEKGEKFLRDYGRISKILEKMQL
jgi:predicted transcriptional regulator